MPLTSEAQILVDRMMAAGMQPVEIANAIGVRSQQIRDIRRRKSSGNTHVDKLRVVAAGVAEALPTKVDHEERGSKGDSQGMTTGAATTTDHATATIEAEDAPKDERSTFDKAKDKIKAMLLGEGGPTISVEAPRKSGGGDKHTTFVDQIVPTLALMVTIGADLLIHDPYKPVAPSDEEAAVLVRPWVRIMARQLEIAGHLTETQLDIITALGASTIYGRRAWKTYTAIRAEEERRNASTSTGARSSANGYSNSYDGAYRDAAGAIVTGGQRGAPASRGPLVSVASGAGHAATHDSAGGPTIDPRFVGHAGSGVDPIADLYSRDAEGRRAAGLD